VKQRANPTLAAVLVIATAAAAGTFLLRPTPTTAANPLSTVSVQDLHRAAQAGARVIDVREPFEFNEGHVQGAILVPLGTVAARAGEFPKDEPIYVFCRSGNRSLQAAQTLVEAGYSDVRNVEGGIIAWVNAGLPVVR
jgi:phage shock protein E